MDNKTATENIIEVENLQKYFPVRRGITSRIVAHVKAVDSVSFSIKKGETLGLIGESGCGKSTTGRTILRLLEPTAGCVMFDGINLFSLNRSELRKIRCHMQFIFQDPFGSLNPRMKIGEVIGEPLVIHKAVSSWKEARDNVANLLQICGLSPDFSRRYPHELSGGQRQRIGIARALALHPSFVICDEPVSALDVSIQAQIINLLENLRKEFRLSYLFITHDLSVAKHISDRVAIMYLGRIVELSETLELYNNPQHPYTEALLSAVPLGDPTLEKKRIVLEGDVPSPLNPPSGCCFHPRCRYKMDECDKEEPKFLDIGNGHYVACHLRT